MPVMFFICRQRLCQRIPYAVCTEKRIALWQEAHFVLTGCASRYDGMRIRK